MYLSKKKTSPCQESHTSAEEKILQVEYFNLTKLWTVFASFGDT